ncbi:MAG: Smr/MutS family protein [Treponema sp.]|nr:Smr/MutS family protein [Treponema sp.]
MDITTLTELDYYRIRDTIAGYCVSEEGKAFLLSREPFTDTEQIESRKNLSREWQLYNTSTHSSALSMWPAVLPLLRIMKVEGAALSLEQVHTLGLFCTAVKKVTSGIINAETELALKHLADTVRTIPDVSSISAEIYRVITPDGEIKDLPELREIRKRIADLNRKILNLMHAYTSDQKLSSVLESTVPVYRTGHQLLAVYASQRNRIPGIIHEVSQSGQTVYIEPEDAVKASNDLVQEEFNLQLAVRTILRTLTGVLAPYADTFNAALPVMITLDTTCAVSRWGIEHNCIYALPCSDDQPLTIIQARHPLLGEKAVPIDVRFMQGKRVLIITGPNTGGKTVTLKTIALFSMLNQSGFPVPAKEGTRLPVFSGVFADIGDGQSLDQSLSTFSAHMKNIARALSESTSASLVLLDELGSGTDPQEGAAIGMAVLDTLIEREAFVLVTTHQGVLKNYGWTHPACINASVEFNSETLSPTYRLLMGVPGESRALDIAAKSGLPDDVVAKARSYIVNEQADISALIKGLTAKHTELDDLLNMYRQKEYELTEQQRKADFKDLSLRQKEHELKNTAHTETAQFLADSRKQLENLVRTLREGEITREKTLAVKQYISDLTNAVGTQEAQLEAESAVLAHDINAFGKIQNMPHPHSNKSTKRRMKNAEALKLARNEDTELFLQSAPGTGKNSSHPSDSRTTVPLSFKSGASVLIGKERRSGLIISPDGKGKWLVQTGSIKMTVKQKDLELVAPSRHVNTPLVTVDTAGTDESEERPVFELRLLGMREDEAVKALEHQLDLCAIHNFRNFSIIHGKGNGILQVAVQHYLSHYAGVKEFHFAPPEDGGTGKTYVTLR